MIDLEQLVASAHARLDALESMVEDQAAIIEELRYASPSVPRLAEDDYDYYTDGEWDAL